MDLEDVTECGATEAQCRCNLPAGHPPPHECEDRVTCNGAWWIDASGDFKVYRWPKAGGIL